MVADGMLTRKRYREVPPRVDYELTDRARELMPILGELARWGYEWAWRPPRASESVDIGAIFRLAPGPAPRLESSGARSSARSRVTPPAPTRSRLSPTESTIDERPAAAPDASLTGGVSAWIDAFSPQSERGGLEISGDRAVANQVLDALSGASPAQAAAAGSSNPRRRRGRLRHPGAHTRLGRCRLAAKQSRVGRPTRRPGSTYFG